MKNILKITITIIFGFLTLKQFGDIYIVHKYDYIFTEQYNLMVLLRNENPYILMFKENLHYIMLLIYGFLFILSGLSFLDDNEIKKILNNEKDEK